MVDVNRMFNGVHIKSYNLCASYCAYALLVLERDLDYRLLVVPFGIWITARMLHVITTNFKCLLANNIVILSYSTCIKIGYPASMYTGLYYN